MTSSPQTLTGRTPDGKPRADAFRALGESVAFAQTRSVIRYMTNESGLWKSCIQPPMTRNWIWNVCNRMMNSTPSGLYALHHSSVAIQDQDLVQYCRWLWWPRALYARELVPSIFSHLSIQLMLIQTWHLKLIPQVLQWVKFPHALVYMLLIIQGLVDSRSMSGTVHFLVNPSACQRCC